jgi:hypothetical protein
MKKLLGALLVVVLLGGIYFGYEFFQTPVVSEKAKSHPKVSLKLLPFPLIIADDGSKNDSLLELLLNKESKIINVHDGRLKFDNVLPFGSEVEIGRVFLNFAYDHKENKVKFSGDLNNSINTKVSGEYYLNDKNNIVYNLNFNSPLYNIIISGNYKFLDDQEGVLEGSFSCSFGDVVQFLNLTNNNLYQNLGFNVEASEPFTINGDYIYQDNKLNLSNVVLKSKDIDSTLKLDFSNENNLLLNIYLDINYLNIDSLISTYNLNNGETNSLKIAFSNYLLKFLDSYNKNAVFQTKISGTQIVINNANITNLLLDVNSQQNKGLVVNKLNLTLPGESTGSATGVITANQYRPQFEGEIDINSKGLNDIFLFIDEDSYIPELQDNIPFTLNTKVLITPVLNLFSNVNFNVEGGTVGGDLICSNYGLQNVVHSDFNIDNLNINLNSLLKYDPINDFIIRSNSPDFISYLMQLKSVQFIHDSDLQFNDVILNGKPLDQVNFEFVVKPEIIELNSLKVKSDSLKFSGDILINVQGIEPFLGVSLQGDLFNSSLLENMFFIYEEPDYYTKGDVEGLATDHASILNRRRLEIFRFDKFIGYVQMNFKKLSNLGFDINNFNFFASIKDNVMQIEKLNANIFGGYFQLIGNMSFLPFASNISYSLADADLGQITSEVFKNNDITGNINLVGNLASSGRTLGDLLNRLNGSTEMSSNNLLVDNFNINSFVTMYGKSSKNLSKNINIRTGSTQFNQISGNIGINDGLFNSNQVNFETDNNINGATNFNFSLIDNSMKSITSFAYVDAEGNVDGFNISLNGPINNLKLQLGN